MYVELELIHLGQGDKKEPLTINRDSISYYRAYIQNAEQGNEGDMPIVMLYLKGSVKGMKILSTYDAFKRKIGAKAVDLTGLSDTNVEKVQQLVKELRSN